MSKFIEQFKVEIPRWQREYVFKSEVKPVYYKKGMTLPQSYKKRIANGQYTWKSYGGADTLWHVKKKKFILKNSKTANEPKTWNVNGQGFCSLHWRVKDTLTSYYKRYFSGFVVQQLKKIDTEKKTISIAIDIYEIVHKDLPDIDNLAWIIRKWFTDTLHENSIIPGDDYKVILETGKSKYVLVEKDADRKLIFKINVHEKK